MTGSDRVVEAPSPNRQPRAGVGVDTLVLHYTGMASGAAALARLRDPEAAVSAHWLVDEAGTCLRLVDEAEEAWHAGVSAWAGASGLNARSIGVEIVNGGHDHGLPPYPPRQIAAVNALCQDILARWPIPPWRVVGHSDIAPMRKRDPGERFPWAALAEAGVGLWPTSAGAAAPTPHLTRTLTRIGYVLDGAPQPTTISAVLAAFQRRFAPEGRIDGRDEPPTRRRLAEIEAAYLLARSGRDT